MENATLLTYLAALSTAPSAPSSPSPSPSLAPSPLPLPRPSPRPPGYLPPAHPANFNQRNGPKRHGTWNGGSGRGGAHVSNGHRNSSTLDRPMMGAIVIGSIFLFITMSITAAVLVFCKKKNTVFIFGAGGKNDDLYTDTSMNLNPDDLLDDASDDLDDEEEGEEEEDEETGARRERWRQRRREEERLGVALDPRLLRDPRGLELIALTSGCRNLDALYRDLVRHQQLRSTLANPDARAAADVIANTGERQFDAVNNSRNGDVTTASSSLPSYRLSAGAKYRRMQCAALIEQHDVIANPTAAAMATTVLSEAEAVHRQLDECPLRSPVHEPRAAHVACLSNPHASPCQRPWQVSRDAGGLFLPAEASDLRVTVSSGQRLVQMNEQTVEVEEEEEEEEEEKEEREQLIGHVTQEQDGVAKVKVKGALLIGSPSESGEEEG